MCRWARKAIAVVMLEGAANQSLLPGGFLWLKLQLSLHNGKGIR